MSTQIESNCVECTPFHTETIRCPNCELVQEAKVFHFIPWPSFTAECQGCAYLIMESEWEQVDAAKVTPSHSAEQIRVMVDMADYAESLLNRHVTVMEVGKWLDLLGSESECEKFTQGLAMWQNVELCHWDRGPAWGSSAVAGSGGRMRFVG